jgi:hypothetical protein
LLYYIIVFVFSDPHAVLLYILDESSWVCTTSAALMLAPTIPERPLFYGWDEFPSTLSHLTMSARFRLFLPVGVKKGQRIDTKPTPNACAWILHDVSERNTMDLISFVHTLITFEFHTFWSSIAFLLDFAALRRNSR